MRLAFTLFEYPPRGGWREDLRRLFEEALRAGHACRLYCPDRVQDAPDGLEVQPLRVPGRARHRRHQAFVARVGEELARTPADAVVGFEPMPGLDILLASGDCFLHAAQQRRGWMARRGAAYRHFSSCERAVFEPRAATGIMFLSEVQRAGYLDCYHTPAARCRLLPPGIAGDRCAGEDVAARRRAARESLGVVSGEHLLLFAGTDFRRQGLERAIRALAHAREEQPHQAIRLLVAGGESYRSFHHLARKLGVREQVQFLGWRDDLPELLLAADALVHPAHREVAGRVLLEALASGLPVIATQACGYAAHIAAARAGMVLRSPFQQEDLDHAVLRTLDGIYRAQCRETGLVYARLTDLYSLHATAVRLIAQWGQDRWRG